MPVDGNNALRSIICKNLHTSPYDPRASTLQVPEWLAQARSHGLLSQMPAEIVSAMVAGAYPVEYPARAGRLRWDASPENGVVLRSTLKAYISLPDAGQAETLSL